MVPSPTLGICVFVGIMIYGMTLELSTRGLVLKCPVCIPYRRVEALRGVVFPPAIVDETRYLGNSDIIRDLHRPPADPCLKRHRSRCLVLDCY